VRQVAALGCLATIAVADYVVRHRQPRWLVSGLFDHPAHVATAGLVLLNLPPRSGAWTAGFLAGSLLPDLDHVPLALAPKHPGLDDPRPRSHSLVALASLAAVTAARAGAVRGAPAEVAGGAIGGALTHYGRDAATGPGLPLLWPASDRDLRLPWPAYAAACLFLAGRASLRNGL
jgi:inner membrane protein